MTTDDLLTDRMQEYIQHEREWLDHTKLKVGDKVVFVQGCSFPQMGEHWLAIGETYTVDGIGRDDDKAMPWGIRLKGIKRTTYPANIEKAWVAFHCLIPVENDA